MTVLVIGSPGWAKYMRENIDYAGYQRCFLDHGDGTVCIQKLNHIVILDYEIYTGRHRDESI